MTVRDRMAWADRRIFRSAVVQALATFGSTELVPGAFHQQPREISLPGGSVMHVGLSFDTRYIAELALMNVGDDVTIQGYGSYRFLRELLPGGDESGLTIVELGEKL